MRTQDEGFGGYRYDYVAKRNMPRSIYQYSNMATRISGQTSIFGVVFFVSRDEINFKKLQFYP